MLLTPAAVLSWLSNLTDINRIVVAYSGGLDSHVLLHTLVALREGQSIPFVLEALHIHHGVSSLADDWATHCQTVCQRLQVPLTVEQVSAKGSQASLENQLREARYQIFAEQLNKGDLLALAHHADDQAETLLLRLLRGTGPQGLAGMPERRKLGKGNLIRPLLAFSRADLEAYAQQHQLHWVEDDSNEDTCFDRNYLRHEVMPKLAKRWPHFRETFARNAQVVAEAGTVLGYFLERELERATGENNGGLECDWLLGFEAALQRNLLRAWLKNLGLPLPGYKHLQQIIDEVIGAADGASPLLCWPGVEVRRFQGTIYALRPLAEHHSESVFYWALSQCLVMPGAGQLTAELFKGGGLLVPESATITVTFRQGGERCQIAGRAHSKLLKKQLQELQVPTWLRDRVPLVYINDDLAAIADLCICEGFQASPGQSGYVLKWRRP